ncbi:MAG TPA: hypothetical protein DIW31_10225 [Bacteroidales bacterium]|nr:hypothetical protein [Bacteroidales bacterium]
MENLDAIRYKTSSRNFSTEGDMLDGEEVLYHDIVENAPRFIAIVQEGKYVFVNSSGLKLFRYKNCKLLVGKGLIESVAPNHRSAVSEWLNKVEGNVRLPVIFKFHRADKTSFSFEGSFSPFTYKGNPAILIVGKDFDAESEQKLAIKSLDKLHLDILNSFKEVVAFYSPTHEIIWINDSGKKHLKLKDNSYVGKVCHQIWFNANKPCPSCPMVNFKDKTTERTVTFDDNSIWRIRHTPLYDSSKQLTGYIEFRRNITDEVLKERKQKRVAIDALYLNQKNSILSEIEAVLNRTLSNKKYLKQKDDFKRIFDIIDSYKHLDKDWKMFIANFEEVHPGFLRKLTDTYPLLTPNDIKHCACVRMNYDTKEIARFFNIKASSVQISRVRLKKKMNLSDSVDLRNFLLNF